MMIQIIRSILSLFVVFWFIGCGGDSNTTETTSINPTNINKATFEVSKVQGNTVEYDSVATFTIKPSSKPSANISISLESSDENEGVVEPTELVFTPENWDIAQTVKIIGRNRNVVNDKQNYQIIISPAQSSDERYSGVDIDDIQINGIELKLSKPTNLYSFISNIESTISLDVTYNSNKILSYSLLEKPDGMTIDSDTGLITWTAPESAEGDSYDVKVKVTDGVLSDEISFSVSVAESILLETQIKNNTLIVKSSSICNFNGINGIGKFSITVPKGQEALLNNIKITKINSNTFLSDIPKHVKIDSCLFSITGLPSLTEKYHITLPLYNIGEGNIIDDISLYHYTNKIKDNIGFDWIKYNTDIEISSQNIPILNTEARDIEGIYFIGHTINSSLKEKTINDKKETLSPLFRKRKGASCITKKVLKFIPTSPYFEYKDKIGSFICKLLDKNGVETFKATIDDFGISKHWGASVEDLFEWLIDAKEKFDVMKLNYSSDVKVKITTFNNPNILGKFDGQSLKLKDDNLSLIEIKATTVHEFFHHAQQETLVTNGGNIKNFYSPSSGDWIWEGTARWFEDEIYDSENAYVKEEGSIGNRILEKGLNAKKDNDNESRTYQRFLFYKLIANKCTNFSVKPLLIETPLISNPLDINRLTQTFDNSCNFGNHLGARKKSTLESALVYYQYATLYKNKISLLDSNEDDTKFSFQETNYIFSNWFNSIDDWIDNNNLEHKLNIPQRIPPIGAFSFYIKPIQGVIPDNKEAVLKIKSDGNLTVSIVSPDEDFLKGGNTIDAENGKTDRHKWFNCEKECEFSYEFDDKMPKLFVSLVNPNTTKNVDDVNVTFDIVNKNRGHINTIVNFNPNTIDPNKKVFISLTKIDMDESAGVIDTVEINTSTSPFIYEFKNLKIGKYATMLHSQNKTILYGDVKETEITKENPTAQIEHQLEMNYEELSTKFTESLVRGKWKVNSDTYNVEFNANKTISGLWSNYIWSVNDDGELELSLYLLGNPITTKFLKIVENMGGECYRVNATETNSYWHEEYKMCQ